ncbi:MAG: bifunctional riboflavin kinase/FAD synthetase [Clostridia bacterium]|nr:bifunctional riboflavin kinase/FAD synthetase [Clostridia bacterium]
MTKTVVALGNFDGMHMGHTAVLSKALNADGFIPCALLFTEHSEKTLKGAAPPMLMTDSERRCFIAEKGFRIEEVSFNSICNFSPEEFVDEILCKKLNAGAVVCGYNYRFGRKAAGDSQLLSELCRERNIDCYIVSKVSVDGADVSSTAIRKLIENGEIRLANRMLGRFFGYTAPVIHGDRRGSQWGFPTANQLLPDGFVMPKFGVYATIVTVNGKQYRGVTNIGKRPTVGTDIVLSETNILGFEDDIYGQNVDIRLIDFIRPERKFSSFSELAQQIKADTAKAEGCEAEYV